MDPRLYNLHPHEQQRVANYFEPGMPVDRLEDHDDFGSWTILRRGPDRWLMQHYNRALMWVDVKGGKAMSYELVLGPDAIALDKQIQGTP
jgi:hypothetical protein